MRRDDKNGDEKGTFIAVVHGEAADLKQLDYYTISSSMLSPLFLSQTQLSDSRKIRGLMNVDMRLCLIRIIDK